MQRAGSPHAVREESGGGLDVAGARMLDRSVT